MSEPISVPNKAAKHHAEDLSPKVSPKPHLHLIPSPIPTRRTRTYSATERAMAGPQLHGTVKTFCREKGHGFITPKGNAEPIFVHISDIEGEFVPKAGDEVSYKASKIPPKMDKVQAVHVRILNPAEGVKHERWDAPVTRTASGTPGS